jgi:hypothetical protein
VSQNTAQADPICDRGAIEPPPLLETFGLDCRDADCLPVPDGGGAAIAGGKAIIAGYGERHAR